MKNILNYYYKMIVNDEINDNEYFSYNNNYFCLYEYKRNINEINALDLLNKLMINNNMSVNMIISNIFDNVITYHNNKKYVLVMINYNYLEDAKTMFVKSFHNKELDILNRNNWGKLWSIKVDYIEYQLMHIKDKYPIINSSINYYIGLAENAISYFNMLDLNNVSLYIEHRRITNSNLYNPLELVIDYKTRDISEYIKDSFFNKKKTINEIIDYLKGLELENIDYILLYVRLLYPSYYFDLYEEIVNNNLDEDSINNIIGLSSVYEEFLYKVYVFFKTKINILGIDWINTKFM